MSSGMAATVKELFLDEDDIIERRLCPDGLGEGRLSESRLEAEEVTGLDREFPDVSGGGWDRVSGEDGKRVWREKPPLRRRILPPRKRSNRFRLQVRTVQMDWGCSVIGKQSGDGLYFGMRTPLRDSPG